MHNNKNQNMSATEFIEYIKSKGWSRSSLIMRWNLEGKGRIVRFEDVQLPSRSVFFNDALAGLPEKNVERAIITPDQFIQILAEKGWNQITIAQRWGLSARRINTIVNSAERSLSFDDALIGSPTCTEIAWLDQINISLLAERGWTLKAILARWPVTERELKKLAERPGGQQMLLDWFKGLPHNK